MKHVNSLKCFIFVTVALSMLAIPVQGMAYDLLILTPQEFEVALQPLVEHKNRIHMPTMVKTLQSIYEDPAYAQGWDAQEKIKLAIADAHETFGIKYVMLVGDVDKFPVRYTRNWDSVHWGHTFTPSDLYYADLYDNYDNDAWDLDTAGFDEWDSNNNHLFGESGAQYGYPANWDELNVDKADLKPDVAVGRIPASSVEEVQTMVDKIKTYELNLQPWFNRMMLVTGHDWEGNNAIADSIANLMEPLEFESIQYYWNEMPHEWGWQNFLNAEMNNGVGFVVYIGHGDGDMDGISGGYGGFWEIWRNDNYGSGHVPMLDNAGKLPVILAAACGTAQFHFTRCPYEDVLGSEYRDVCGLEEADLKYTDDPEPAPVQPSNWDTDCMAEYFLVRNGEYNNSAGNIGGIAYIGSITGAQDGSADLVKHFFEQFEALGGAAILGDVWNKTLEAYIRLDFPRISFNTWTGPALYQHVHKMMLFGDPSLRLGIGGVEVSPMNLNFGNSFMGLLKNLHVNIRNMNGSDLTISEISLSDQTNYTIWPPVETPVIVPPGETRTVSVTFIPQDSGSFPANLMIVSDDLVTPTVNVGLNGESTWMFDNQLQPPLVHLNYLDRIYEHWETMIVERYMDPIEVIIDWPANKVGKAMTEMKLTIYDPKGEVYIAVRSSTSPIAVNVSNARIWSLEVQDKCHKDPL